MNLGNDVMLVEDTLYILQAHTDIPIYDFDFRAYFPCRATPQSLIGGPLIARIGAIDDYNNAYAKLLEKGIRLLHSPEEHSRSSQLSGWYNLIEEFTPRSRLYASIPTVAQVQEDFAWPVFVKGDRQTSQHQKSLSIIRNSEDYQTVAANYQADRILHWQPMVVRELVALRCVEDADPNRIPSSFEFRTFWWKGECVGTGRYWWQGRRYDWNEDERRSGLAVAEQAAKRVNVPFLVIDLAMTDDGRWIVIECNDGQESGYAGVSPLGLWTRIIELERTTTEKIGVPDHV
jgi:hypothetical protein